MIRNLASFLAPGRSLSPLELAKRVALLLGLTLLAAATVFVNNIAHGKPLDDEIVVDAIVGVMLAATTLAGGAIVLRLSSHRTRLEHRQLLSEALRSLSETSQSATIIAVLPRHARELLNAAAAVLLVAEDEEPEVWVIAGASGLPEDRIGQAVTRSGPLGNLLHGGPPILFDDARRSPPFDDLPGQAQAHGAVVPLIWRSQTRGALAVAAGAERPQFEPRDLEILNRIAELGALALEQAEMRAHFERAAQAGVDALAAAVDQRDGYTAEHSEEVVELARAVGQRLGLDGPSLSDLEVAARLHDVGKIGVPDSILLKPGPLDKDEWTIMKQHPAWGAQMLAKVPELAGLAVLIRHEHERWDGTGYPDGLRGEEIPLPSRIVFACDAFHAMTSDRCYRAAVPPEQAIKELQANAGSQFDPRTVDALCEAVGLAR